MAEEKQSIRNMIDLSYLDQTNTEFYRRGDFLAAKITKNGETVDCGRVILHRLFPFSELYTNISVQNPDGEEVGLIADVNSYPSDVAEMLRKEIDERYFVPTILAIDDLKERFGISTWKVRTDVGDITFSVRDTYRSMTFSGNGTIYILDADGNRYVIDDVNKLDSKSYRKIELYI